MKKTKKASVTCKDTQRDEELSRERKRLSLPNRLSERTLTSQRLALLYATDRPGKSRLMTVSI